MMGCREFWNAHRTANPGGARDRFDRTAGLARSSSPLRATTQSFDLAVSETLQERAAFTAPYDASSVEFGL
jgi:hypothetical protein